MSAKNAIEDAWERTCGRARVTYDTKTLRFHFPGRGQYLIVMLTRFDGADHLLGEIGYGGEYIRYGSVSMGTRNETVATGDPFAFAREHPWGEDIRESYAFDLLYALDTGDVPWHAIADGMKLDADAVADLLDEYTDDEDEEEDERA